MTFAFHSYSGMVLCAVVARLLGQDQYIWGLFGFLVGGFPDTAGAVLAWLSKFSWWKWRKWTRWEFYVRCHPLEGYGDLDKIYRWCPPWGQHTWIWDPIVHPGYQKRFIFPQFKREWQEVVWIRIWPSHWNIEWTKWDVLYVLLEATLWILYTLALIYV